MSYPTRRAVMYFTAFLVACEGRPDFATSIARADERGATFRVEIHGRTGEKPVELKLAVPAGKPATIPIASKSGIGSATIRLADGNWPKKVVLRFHYSNGKPFEMLEGLHLKNKEVKIEGSMKRPAQVTAAGPDASGVRNLIEERKLEISAGNEGLDVELPMDLVGRDRVLQVRWVDWYR